jgi:phage terminase large subunit GpA-like protein
MAVKTASALSIYLEALAQGLTPDPPLWVDEWAATYGVIPRGTAAEYGRYRVERTPYAREVLRCLSPSHPARRVVAKVASQLFKTQCGLMGIGAWMHRAPGNILVLEPTGAVAKRVSSRVDRTIASTPELAAIVAKPRSRDARNTVDTKEFAGGTLFITTAGSASNLAEVPVRYIYGDEIDRWEVSVDGEGSPRELAETRASTFGRNAKIYYSSSPTEEGNSEIDTLYRQSDQRVYEVPCPHCGHRQALEWGQVRWTEHASDAWYECGGCGERIGEHHKPAMLAAGEWRATATGDGETVGFALNALYSPLGWTSWRQLAQQFQKASTALERGDMEAMQVFYNTRIGLCWDLATERVQADQLRASVEDFPLGVAPVGALVLTAAVDVQADRLEVLVLGWGEGMERWTVAQHVVRGDPADRATWKDLDQILLTPIHNAYGVPMAIEAVAVDSGFATQDVYDFARTRRRRRILDQAQAVLAVKGHARPGRPVIAGKPSKVEVTARGTV